MSAVAALVARFALAAAFAASATAKFRRPASFERALAGFGIPAAGVVARVLPPLEAGVAVSLLALPRRSWPALVALGLLAFLTVAVVANLASGRAAPCPCFDPESDRPVSPATVARNGVLAAMAVVATGPVEGADAVSTAVAALVAVPLTVLVLRRVG